MKLLMISAFPVSLGAFPARGRWCFWWSPWSWGNNDWPTPLFDALSCKERNHALDGLGQGWPSPSKVGRRPTSGRAHRRTGTRNQRRTDQKITCWAL